MGLSTASAHCSMQAGRINGQRSYSQDASEFTCCVGGIIDSEECFKYKLLWNTPLVEWVFNELFPDMRRACAESGRILEMFKSLSGINTLCEKKFSCSTSALFQTFKELRNLGKLQQNALGVVCFMCSVGGAHDKKCGCSTCTAASETIECKEMFQLTSDITNMVFKLECNYVAESCMFCSGIELSNNTSSSCHINMHVPMRLEWNSSLKFPRRTIAIEVNWISGQSWRFRASEQQTMSDVMYEQVLPKIMCSGLQLGFISLCAADRVQLVLQCDFPGANLLKIYDRPQGSMTLAQLLEDSPVYKQTILQKDLDGIIRLNIVLRPWVISEMPHCYGLQAGLLGQYEECQRCAPRPHTRLWDQRDMALQYQGATLHTRSNRLYSSCSKCSTVKEYGCGSPLDTGWVKTGKRKNQWVCNDCVESHNST